MFPADENDFLCFWLVIALQLMASVAYMIITVGGYNYK
jgi:hypothetical protein